MKEEPEDAHNFEFKETQNEIKIEQEPNNKVDLNLQFICDNCGKLNNLEVPLTAAFFWPE